MSRSTGWRTNSARVCWLLIITHGTNHRRIVDCCAEKWRQAHVEPGSTRKNRRCAACTVGKGERKWPSSEHRLIEEADWCEERWADRSGEKEAVRGDEGALGSEKKRCQGTEF